MMLVKHGLLPGGAETIGWSVAASITGDHLVMLALAALSIGFRVWRELRRSKEK